jgi:hypothetical protein
MAAAIRSGGPEHKLHAKDVGSYAIFGAIYFCLAGVLLARKLARGPSETSGVMGRSGMEPHNVGAPPLEEMWEESNTPT